MKLDLMCQEAVKECLKTTEPMKFQPRHYKMSSVKTRIYDILRKEGLVGKIRTEFSDEYFTLHNETIDVFISPESRRKHLNVDNSPNKVVTRKHSNEILSALAYLHQQGILQATEILDLPEAKFVALYPELAKQFTIFTREDKLVLL